MPEGFGKFGKVPVCAGRFRRHGSGGFQKVLEGYRKLRMQPYAGVKLTETMHTTVYYVCALAVKDAIKVFRLGV